MSGIKTMVRCAVYTRKSHEEGLDQEFNSLDAQREAGEAFVASQRGEGWTLVADDYDDGGFTGGNMERPALKRLMKDIDAGLIDVVIVYKIDRLTRSLYDFAQMMEIFDRHGVSFVSVTQQFNTTTSMGRLTLNMLLSFAQFEREITGERIRDKLAASKRKGMWMGGTPPLGYDVIDRKLEINPAEAEAVRFLFERFISVGSVTAVAKEARERGLRSKTYVSRRGNRREGKPMDKGFVYKLLSNRLYLGEIVHGKESYPGQHAAIIDRATWDAARAVMRESPRARSNAYRRTVGAALRGVLVCGGCKSGMTATSTCRRGRTYRYYTPNNHIKKSCASCPVGNIPAGEIEGIVLGQLQPVLASPEMVAEAWRKIQKEVPGAAETDVRHALDNVSQMWDELFPAEQDRLIRRLIKEVVVHPDTVEIALYPEHLAGLARETLARREGAA